MTKRLLMIVTLAIGMVFAVQADRCFNSGNFSGGLFCCLIAAVCLATVFTKGEDDEKRADTVWREDS